MNRRQRNIVIAALILLALNLIYVPYKTMGGENLGYSTILTPIKYEHWIRKDMQGEINYEMLILQSGIIILITAALIFVAGRKP